MWNSESCGHLKMATSMFFLFYKKINGHVYTFVFYIQSIDNVCKENNCCLMSEEMHKFIKWTKIPHFITSAHSFINLFSLQQVC